MQRGVIVGIVVTVLVVGGVGAAVTVTALGGSSPETVPSSTSAPAPADVAEAPAAESDAGEKTPDAAAPTADANTVTPGAYVDYSDAALASAEGTRILFFHATWCTQCRALDADIETSGVPDGITILKVDYDSHQDLRQRYGVTLQTTVVELDDAGGKAASFVPYDDPTLASSLAGLGLTG